MKRILLMAGVLLAFALLLGFSGQSIASDSASAPAAHAGHGHEDLAQEEADLNPLTWRTDVALWTLVVFVLLVTILGKFGFAPIAKALDAREQAVADNISSAQQANDEAKSILAQYQQKLADSKDEVRQILDTARKDAQRAADGIMEKAKEAAGMEHSRAVKEIEAATANALQAIAEKSATLATDLAGKMIRKEVSPDAHRDLIRGAMDEFAKN